MEPLTTSSQIQLGEEEVEDKDQGPTQVPDLDLSSGHLNRSVDSQDDYDDDDATKIQTTLNKRNKFEILVMSEAGKLIYSYSKREDAITLMPLCTALMNYAKRAQKETLNCIKTSSDLIINFTTRPPLIIIVMHQANSYVDPMVLIEQVEAQIISILTAQTLRSIFDERPTFDLKRLLYGSEKLIDSILNLSVQTNKSEWPWTQSFLAVTAQSSSAMSSSTSNNGTSTTATINLLPAAPSPSLPLRPHRVLIPVVYMPPGIRSALHNNLHNVITSNSKNMVFSLLFRVISSNNGYDGSKGVEQTQSNDAPTANQPETGDAATTTIEDNDSNQDDKYQSTSKTSDVNFQLITVCNHHDRHKLKISDIHIILALLHGLKAQLVTVESLWMPVCLPRFNENAFLHSYISYINNTQNCLVMMSVDRDEFANCQKSRDTIEDKIDVMLKDPNQKAKIYSEPSPLVHPILIDLHDELTNTSLSSDELADVQQKAQIFNSKFELYNAKQLQFLWYQTSKQVLWWQRSPKKPLNPVLYYVTTKMLKSSLKTLWLNLEDNSNFLGWHVPTFQLYAQFDGTITTNEATEVIQRITNWIKKEEDNFTIRDYR